ncbi:MAG: Na+/H+ antiporter NhaA [Thermomicrobiales bacterium]
MSSTSNNQGRVREASRLEQLFRPLDRLFETQAASGVVLLIAAILAFVWANSPWASSYSSLWETQIDIAIGGDYGISKSLVHWINDGLMTLFFVVVGLEIKREVLVGEISSLRRAAFPLAAALGGAIVPAAIFLSLNWGQPTSTGWGIPLATDIAFVLGILALLRSRIPPSFKVLVTAAAIVDDILAILIIAFFYTEQSPADLSSALQPSSWRCSSPSTCCG